MNQGESGYLKIGEYSYHDSIYIREPFYHKKNILEIGKFCSIGGNVIVFLERGNHVPNWVSTYPFDTGGFDVPKKIEYPDKGGVKIGNDVFIGNNVTILSGVVIEDGAVIGTHTVVSKNVPAYSIFVGNPGRVVKKRFSDKQIEELLKIQWWHWEIEKINKYASLLFSNKIDNFIELAKSDLT
jgi:virginiamycin A acetyltransferase